jgi:Outer membrane lipoprotein Slp family
MKRVSVDRLVRRIQLSQLSLATSPIGNRSIFPSAHRFGCILLSSMLFACSAVPAKYRELAVPDVTLTAMTASPQQYRDKVVILGGVLVKEREEEGHVWLHLKNRPLDAKYHPHRPLSLEGPEAGHFWVTAPRQDLPAQYRKWARMTVVGRVIGTTREEPVLLLMYARGWDVSGQHDEAWETSINPAYLPVIPEGLHGEFQP